MALTAGIAVLASSAGIAHFVSGHNVRAVYRHHLKLRSEVYNQWLAAQDRPYVALAGDSHAELLDWDRLCGLPVINLGMSGASTKGYRALADQIRFPESPVAMLLFIGTNDLAHSRRPRDEKSLNSFRTHFEALVRTLGQATAILIHVPLVPDVAPSVRHEYIDGAAVEEYRLAAESICRKTGCHTAFLGGMQASFQTDRVHLDVADRREGASLHRRMEATLCHVIQPDAQSLQVETITRDAH